MKKKMFFCFVALVLMALLSFGVYEAAAAPGEKPIKISLANMFPPMHYMSTEQVALWTKEIEAATHGKVKIIHYPGGTLLKGSEMFEGVVSGAADIGIAAFGYTRGRHPLLQVFELPGIYFGSATASGMLAKEVVKKFKPAELSDVKVVYLYGCGPGHLYATKPVHKLEDLKGMRIRSVGLTTKAFKALGAVPVSMTQAGVYDALSKGIVDGTVAPPEVLKGYRQAEVTKYLIITPPLMMGLHFCVMNLDKWNSLPTDVKRAFDDVNDKFVEKSGKIWDHHQKVGMDYGIQHGMKVIKISGAEADRWIARVTPIQDEYVADMAAKGLPGKELLDFVLENAGEYAKRYGAPIYEY